MKAEKTIQKEIQTFIKEHGGYVIKVMKANENGVHDLLACINGLFVSIEVKAEEFHANPHKQASEWQKKQLRAVLAANGIAMVVATLQQFITACEQQGLSFD